MKGITKSELEEIKKINLKEYLLKTDPTNFRERKNGTLVYLKDNALVIYDDHGYYFEKVAHSYMDNIGTLRFIYKYDFMEAITKLTNFSKIHLFDSIETQQTNQPLPIMEIPTGIDCVEFVED